MNPLLPYLAHDRRQALASGIELPPLSHGALLFADISGWTALTARLTQELGARRGIDELIERLNRAYEEIIAAVERYGGSVVSFAGDSLTCWFAADAGPRAAASSLAIQASLEAGADPTAPELALTMRAAIAAGELVRFSVGDPALHCLDVVAGSALNRLRRIERLARPREVLIDAATSAGLGDTGLIGERRGRGAVVLRGLRRQPPDQPWPDLAPDATSPALLRPWVFPAVRDRLLHGAGDFLTELRPAAALFARLPALDFRADPGQRHALDRSVRWAQQVVARHDGTLLDVSVDAKGSVIHAAFGAPVAHEDDALRAAAAARELGDAEQGIPGLQIGLALGVVRAGAYGGATRRTYGVLGDAVNVAARLMEQAGPGEILANAALAEATSQDCAWRELPPRSLKGKDQPVTPFRLDGLRAARGGLREPRTAGPIEGRAGELAWLQAGLERASAGRGQFLGVTAEAGMGKSRLLLELMGQARGAGWRVCAGACQSSGTATPYLVWQSLARDLFELDPEQPAESQAAALAAALAALDPALLPRLPLLGVALNLPLPDNELTAGMDARLRKESLAALLVACLRLGARRERLLLVLEDCHWMDPLSHDLLERVSRAIAREPVAIVAAYRSFEAAWLQSKRISALPHFAEVRLGGLEPAAAARLVERRAGQMGLELAPALVGELVARADGTPFYLEELLHYVNENKIDSAGELAGEALPPSLHSLVLSRVDLLNDQQKLTVKLASVIGRVFPAPWLWGYYPALGAPAQVMRDLALLSRLDITPLERTEPDRTYLFKHAITHEVVYESMGFEQRRELHGQLGDFIEAGAGSEQQLDALAFHYRRSNQPAKRRRYGRLAGDHARQAGGYGAAREHYLDALALVEAPRERAELLFDLAGIAELTGRWQEALDRYDEILRHGDALPADWTPRAGHGRAKVLSRQSAYQEALAWLEQAEAGFRALGDTASQAEVLADRASILWRQGELDLGEACLEQALALSSDHPPALARIYNTLGNLAYSRGDLAQAVAHHEQSLRLRQALGDRRGTAGSLTNLGMAAANRGDFERALGLLERSLALTQEIGDAQGCAHGLMNVATMDYKRGELDRARAGYRESIALARELGDRMALVYGLVGAAAVAAAAREAALAIQLMAAAQRGLGELGAVLEPFEQAMADEALAAARELLPAAEIAELQGAALPLDDAASLALGESA